MQWKEDKSLEIDLDSDVLKEELEMAKSRLQEQRDTLSNFSDEGLRVLRLLLLFITAPAAIIGALNFEILNEIYILALSDQDVINIYFGAFTANTVFKGSMVIYALALILNTSAMGLEARGIANGSNPNDVFLALTNEYDRVEYYKVKLREYVVRIDHNDRIIAVMEQFLAVSKACIMMWAILILVLFYSLIVEESIGIHLILLPFLLMILYTKSLPMDYMKSDITASSGPIYETQYRDYLEGSPEAGLRGLLDLSRPSINLISRENRDKEQQDSDKEIDKQ